MSYRLAIALALGVVIGAAAMVSGEADDSPGLQGIGGILIIVCIAIGFRAVRRRR